MRIGTQNLDSSVQVASVSKSNVTQSINTESSKSQLQIPQDSSIESNATLAIEKSLETKKDSVSKEKLEEAVKSLNEFLDIQNKASKFVYHEGLDKYYVRLVDAKTEEVIKEIPPERLLNAFYEMQKLAGMIVDEKI